MPLNVLTLIPGLTNQLFCVCFHYIQSQSHNLNFVSFVCRTLKTLWSYLEREHKVDVSTLWASLVDVVIKTLICGESSIHQLTQANLPSRYCSYELFGIDILFDQVLKPWLLEVMFVPFSRALNSFQPVSAMVILP